MTSEKLIIHNDNTDLLSKIQILESKINYYRRYKTIIDKYNNDSNFKDIVDNYSDNTKYINNDKFEIFEDTNKALELIIESKKLELKKIDETIEYKNKIINNISNKLKELQDLNNNITKKKDEIKNLEDHKLKFVNADKQKFDTFYNKIVNIIQNECKQTRLIANNNAFSTMRHEAQNSIIDDYKLSEYNGTYYIDYKWCDYKSEYVNYSSNYRWQEKALELPKIM
jgi:hypothetical protein